ncbi:oxidative stress-induced growth inhibitor 1-like [Battus philenor]|uniref:oxidative stress-induced growth inhibitor 1-like n=1 Tax=Battus philenor TaxID=42288 RepID=UPI0035CFBC27
MRDNMQPCQHTLSDDVIYKEVVVIGNGPSGLVTSYMLAGNVPYLKKEIPEDLPIDEMLRARLSNLTPGQSLLETDLLQLAEGLEGRSQNPLPLLMDNLLRPCADLGLHADSLVEWKYDVEKQVEHVVLGRGPPGGSWNTFPPSLRTLSPAGWLALPPHRSAHAPQSPQNPHARLTARALAQYCRRYVRVCNLQRFFRSGVIVTSVTRSARTIGPPCSSPSCPRAAAFCVSGYDAREARCVRYVCGRVVVACGAADVPNAPPARLASHALQDLAALHHLPAEVANGSSPALVVGSGLSAADAVRALRARRRVLHVHREPPAALSRLPPIAYPDYWQVYKMMLDGPTGNHSNYTPYPDHVVIDVTPLQSDEKIKDNKYCLKRVKLLNLVTNETIEVEVSLIVVLIGSRPDLFFLQTNFSLSDIDVKKDCIKCNEKRKIENERKCFFKNHWHYFKSVLGQSIQSCKSRYLNYTEMGGKTEACMEECKCEMTPYTGLEDKVCQCQPVNPYTGGLGFGVDPNKPVDGRSNPVAIDKSTHELLNAPKGIYALGPLTGDNFIRFIPGGALALVADIHKQMKTTPE